MVVIKNRTPEDPNILIHVLDAISGKNIQEDLKKDPMPIFLAGWDGFALIENTASGTVELRLYTHEAYGDEWVPIHNREYGPLLASGGCVRQTWHGKEYVVPTQVAYDIYNEICRANIQNDISNQLEAMVEYDPDVFANLGMTIDEIEGNTELMDRMTTQVENDQNSNVAYNDTLKGAIKTVLAEYVAEKGGAHA